MFVYEIKVFKGIIARTAVYGFISILTGVSFLNAQHPPIGSLAGSVSAEARTLYPTILLIDNFDDGTPMNLLGGGTGSFDVGGGTTDEQIISTVSVSGAGLQLKYDVNAHDSFAGYWSNMQHDGAPARDFSDFYVLTFYVKGRQGGELFKVELSSGPGGQSSVYINDFLPGGVTTAWQKVTIPLDNFTRLPNMESVYQFVIVFENVASSNAGAPLEGTIYLDNIAVAKTEKEGVRLAWFGTPININSTGGEFGSLAGTGATSSESFAEDSSDGLPYALQLNYNVNASAGSFAGVWSFITSCRSRRNFSRYDSLSFWARGCDVHGTPGIIRIELKSGGSVVSQRNQSISTSWQEYHIPFSHFSGFNGTLDEIVFMFDRRMAQNNIGRLYLDNIQFVNSNYVPPVNYPDAPQNLKLMSQDGGTPVVSGTKFSWINWLSVEADSCLEDPDIESVRFEYRIGSGGDWMPIGEDYSTSDRTYGVYWDTAELDER